MAALYRQLASQRASMSNVGKTGDWTPPQTSTVPDLKTLRIPNASNNLMLEKGPSANQPQGAETKAGLFGMWGGQQMNASHWKMKATQPRAQLAEQSKELQNGSYGTTKVNIDGQDMEVPLWNIDMTPDEAEDAARMRLEWGLDPFAPDSELEQKQNEGHQGPDDNSAGEQDLTYRPNMTPQDMADRYAQTAKPAPKQQGISFAGGGRVPFLTPQQQISGYGSDTVPAALTPGEDVFNKKQESAIMVRPGMKKKLLPDASVAAIAWRL